LNVWLSLDTSRSQKGERSAVALGKGSPAFLARNINAKAKLPPADSPTMPNGFLQIA
jgi:hypothetical protein